jgi:PRTRC genetic system protein A
MSTPTIPFPNLINHRLVTDLPLPPATVIAYEYLIAANGIFLRAENPYLSALIPVHAFDTPRIRGLEPLIPFVTLRHTRLPEAILHATLADARTPQNCAEALIEVLYFFTLRDDTVSVVKPPQTGGLAHVRSDHTPTLPADPVVLELHTHGSMSAFWSDTDNRDEQGFRFYAVVGHLDRDTPTVRLRLGIYGHFWEVPLRVLFDMPEPSVLLYTPATPHTLKESPYDHNDPLL